MALALLVVGFGVAEWMGWPFLAGPMQSVLSKLLDRPVYFDGPRGEALLAAAASSSGAAGGASDPSSDLPHAVGGVRVHLLGGIEVRANRIEVAAPAWSKAEKGHAIAPMLVADDAKLQLRYGDLWRASRGQTLRVRRIEADALDVHLDRLADGRASWQFGKSSAAKSAPPEIPIFENLRVRDGHLALHDAVLDSDVVAKFTLVDGLNTGESIAVVAQQSAAATASAAVASTEAASVPRRSAGSTTASGSALGSSTAGLPAGLHLEATGRYRRLPLNLVLQSTGVLPWVADDAARVAVPVSVNGRLGRARLSFEGSVRDAQNLSGLDGRFSLAGPSLAAVGDVIGITLPTTSAFSTKGVLGKKGAVWTARIDEWLIGGSSLKAALVYDPTAGTPVLAGRIGGSRLLLADLGPTIGTAPIVENGAKPQAMATAAPGRVLPVREFDLPSLRAMDANILFDFQELDLGSPRLQPLAPMRAHLLLQGGVLDLRDIDARTASGQLQGNLSLDGRQDIAIWNSDLRVSQVRLEQWLQQSRTKGSPPYITGRLEGRAKLEGRGRSTAQILASLDGELRGRLREGTVSHLAVEAAGIDFAQALGVWVKGDDSLPMDCALADLQVKHGVARPRVLVVDTTDSVVWIDGSVSLADESLKLQAVVSPKDFSPLALRTPIKLGGTLGAPQVSLAAGPLAGKLAAVGLLALVNPLAAWLPLIDFGSDDLPANVGSCKALAAKVAERQAKASAKS